MAIYLGIDIGTVSTNIALLADGSAIRLLKDAAIDQDLFITANDIAPNQDFRVAVTKYYRHKGNPIAGTKQLLDQVFARIPMDKIDGMRVCGSGGKLLGDLLKVNYENEFKAIARGVGELYPDICTVFEIGGQNAKYLLLEKYEQSNSVGIADYEKSGDCAAGTGSFIDQQASRLKLNVEEIGAIVSTTERSAKIAGRCSVFAKSDMIHAQQKGYTPQEVLKGLCEAVSRNFKGSIVKGKKIKKPVVLIGGVAINKGVSDSIGEVFNLSDNELIVPQYHSWMGAVGTAFAERDAVNKSRVKNLDALLNYDKSTGKSFSANQPLTLENVLLLRDRIQSLPVNYKNKVLDVYLGIDIGSVSTNLVMIDQDGNILKEIYTRTEGRPIEVVNRCLNEIVEEFGDQLEVKGVGTTGSGRELIGELVGADTINDEITAHKTGAEFLARTILDTQPDTIFEIGGQDSKYISIENGVVVDFAMNEACAAGTGSFLEERAEELGISIKNEFAQLAMSSEAPIKLGERCTVFMQQDVATYQQRGASKEELCAGLAYSIVYNYLNRVVRGRKIGNVIFFQGGTAYNDAIASAFAKVLDKEIIVPPYNGVVGAVGVALLAKDKMNILKIPSKFRGFSLQDIDYTLREFTCKACSNYCHMQEFNVEGEKTYWGDQCSDKFRKRQASQKEPVIDDLLGLRRNLFFKDYNPEVAAETTIGFPRAMYIYEHFPFWNKFFSVLGFKVVLSDETNARVLKAGIEAAVAEPCLPIQVYHGHVLNLLSKEIDWIFIPNYISAETKFKDVNSYYCPWGQTIPFVIKNSPVFEDTIDKFISPTLRFRDGRGAVEESLVQALKSFKLKRELIRKALHSAYRVQENFHSELLLAGQEALERLTDSGEIGIVLVGRTYNIYDRGVTLDIGNKLRDYYGVNVIPMDFLPVDTVDITNVNANMYWNYGRKIIAAAKIVGRYPNLHIIYLTNFKCGPDSYIKHYVMKASGKPYLTLQFDGHSNDAGYITRCEAYLDSKGALQWWKDDNQSDMEFIQQEVVLE